MYNTKIEKETPFKRYITKAIEQTSKFTKGHAKSKKKMKMIFFLLLAEFFVNFDVCSIAFGMHL